MTQPTATPVQTFAEKRREAALATVEDQLHTHRLLQSLVIRADGGGRFGVDRIIEVEAGEKRYDTLVSGAYVVEIINYRPDGEPGSLFATVHNGTDDRVRFVSLDVALLHLVSRRNGTADDRGTAAFYAARVVGIDAPY